MKCKHCGQSIKEKKPAIENLYSSFKKENSFEYFMNKTLKRVRNKLKKETGYGIPERRNNEKDS